MGARSIRINDNSKHNDDNYLAIKTENGKNRVYFD